MNTEPSNLRLTSVYSADAIVASGVLPWQFISVLSSATLHPTSFAVPVVNNSFGCQEMAESLTL